MTFVLRIAALKVSQPYVHEFASSHFSFNCESEIRTDEKSYLSSASGEKIWEFGW